MLIFPAKLLNRMEPNLAGIILKEFLHPGHKSISSVF
jgi:hypothetical protein